MRVGIVRVGVRDLKQHLTLPFYMTLLFFMTSIHILWHRTELLRQSLSYNETGEPITGCDYSRAWSPKITQAAMASAIPTHNISVLPPALWLCRGESSPLVKIMNYFGGGGRWLKFGGKLRTRLSLKPSRKNCFRKTMQKLSIEK